MIHRTNYYCPIQEKPPPISGGTGYTRISQGVYQTDEMSGLNWYDSDFLNFVLPVPRGLNSQLPSTVTVLIPVLQKAGLPTDHSDTLAPFPVFQWLLASTRELR